MNVNETSVNSSPTYSFGWPDADERLRELIIYIASRCEQDRYFGATKLNKILWHADVAAFAFYGKPITGVAYQRLNQGPAPKKLLPIKNRMLVDGDILERRPQLGQRRQHRIIPLREPNLDLFTARDIAVVDEVISALWDKNAGEVSTLSHMCGWHVAANGELIPYEAIFLSDEPVTEYDVQRARELMCEHDVDL